MKISLLTLKLVLAAACLAIASVVHLPMLSEFRPWLLIVILVASALTIMSSCRWRGWSRRDRLERLDLAPFALAALALFVAVAVEGRFHHARWTVLHTDPAVLEALGRHIMVGYRDPAFARELVERRAIAGVFLTQRNVADRDAVSAAREIAMLQAIRRRQGLPPLLVATDQEGGAVSRLSPPLDQHPPLARVVQAAKTAEERRTAVTDYARRQGQGLAALGVNLNFAPVVDLDFGINNPNDAYTHISMRAISADPDLVRDVAGWYCDGLATQGVQCTLKHFPGLGRVFDDTHLRDATLNASVDELERADWIPFRSVLGHASHVVMAGHVRLQAVDAGEPASTSARAIGNLLRGIWGYDGIVITDDLCMGAIVYRRGGIERASVDALNAGVDLLLISWDGEQIYPALAALLRARKSLNANLLRQSDERLRTLQGKLIAASAGR